jgi:hypothetical protein
MNTIQPRQRTGSGIFPENFGKKPVVPPDVLPLGSFDPHIDNVSYSTGENQNSRGYGNEADECPVSVGRVDIDMPVLGK